MEPRRDPEVLARMRMALDLYEASEQIMRQNIRRRHPELSEDEVEDRVVEWLMRRPPMGEGLVARPVQGSRFDGLSELDTIRDTTARFW